MTAAACNSGESWQLDTLGWDAGFAANFRPYQDQDLHPARVAITHNYLYQLYTPQGEIMAELAGKLRHQATRSDALPVVGDWVAIRKHSAEPKAKIEALLPRRSCFARKAAAMSMAKALRLCPDLVIVRPDFERYRQVSTQVFAIYRSVTSLVEPLSLDEAYLDVTENEWHEPFATTVAKRLKRLIFEQTRLTVSAGAAPNKFLAKIASDWDKPDGLTIIPTGQVEAFLQKLPVEALWGVGPVTAKSLRAAGVVRLVDVRNVDPQILRNAVGSQSRGLQRLAAGIDDRPVIPNRTIKSSGSEHTYPIDLTDRETIESELDRMARLKAEWLTGNKLLARTVTIKVRYSDFTTVTRSHTAAEPTEKAERIAARAKTLLNKTQAGTRPIRLLGVSLHNLASEEDSVTKLNALKLPI